MQINKYNTCILKQIPGDVRHYHAADTLKEVADVGLLPPTSGKPRIFLKALTALIDLKHILRKISEIRSLFLLKILR